MLIPVSPILFCCSTSPVASQHGRLRCKDSVNENAGWLFHTHGWSNILASSSTRCFELMPLSTVIMVDNSQLGYGTGTAWYKRDASSSMDKSLIEATTKAVQLGYVHLDGAEVYNTEPELGAAIKASKIPRDKLFVTTKVTTNIKDIPRAIDVSLKKLGLDYVDLYLIHEPFFARSNEELQQKWRDMEGVKKSGKARSIGVSNYYKHHLEATLKTAIDPPAINQIEYHPYLQHGDLISYHRQKNIAISAYAPLTPVTRAKDGPLTDYLDRLAHKYAVSPAEILLRWCLDQDVVAITTTSKEQRMSDYLRALTFKLTPKEVHEISDLGKTYHYRAFWNKKFAEDDRS